MKTETATRRDLDELTALNRDYIHSVQHGDAAVRRDPGRGFLMLEPRRVAGR